MNEQLNNPSFECLLEIIIRDEISNVINNLFNNKDDSAKKYLTIKELSSLTGIGTSIIRQLTLSRAMPHREVKTRIIFDKNEIQETIENYKKFGWTNPDNHWDVKSV
ncbi:DNA-binding protein [Cytobacillus gottheilii]|uniref:DNA-binding protein n=1 Tax=Cytobacillus gottheilii TaxID=859144 RepID=UPI000834F576|nr:DNA-binding protein [Cytobacillus gottheilii]